jgi:hypothetical protein
VAPGFVCATSSFGGFMRQLSNSLIFIDAVSLKQGMCKSCAACKMRGAASNSLLGVLHKYKCGRDIENVRFHSGSKK